ncbi:MAG: nitrile hydratase subunit alpha, partial [Pseudomonadota bacterium]
MAPHDAHEHEHEEEHEALVVEDDAGNLEGQIIIDALIEVLTAKGLISRPEITRQIAKLESPGVHLGARVIARAWRDPAYKARLLENGKSAIEEAGVPV